MAQAILESGWVTSELAVNANALFGIKKNNGWTGRTYTKKTQEYVNGAYTTVSAAFRAYDSIEESIEDHSNYLLTAMNGSTRRYPKIETIRDPQEACQHIKDGGYATAPDYVTKLMNVINTYNLTKYDSITTEVKTVATPTIIKKTSTKYNVTYKANRTISYIVIHYTAGVSSKSGSALNSATYFCNGDRQASADFFVDDANIVQFNPDIKNYYCWSVGDGSGGTYGSKCYNNNSINIEICSNNTTGKVTTAGDSYWYFTNAELALAWDLTKYLMATYNIPASNVIRHYDRSCKICPGVVGWIKSDTSKWTAFKNSLSGSTNPYSGKTDTTTTTTTKTTTTTTKSSITFTPSAKEITISKATNVYADSTKTKKVGSLGAGDKAYAYGELLGKTLVTYKTSSGQYKSGVIDSVSSGNKLHYQWFRAKADYTVYAESQGGTVAGYVDNGDEMYIYNQFDGATLVAYWLNSAKSAYKFGWLKGTELVTIK